MYKLNSSINENDIQHRAEAMGSLLPSPYKCEGLSGVYRQPGEEGFFALLYDPTKHQLVQAVPEERINTKLPFAYWKEHVELLSEATGAKLLAPSAGEQFTFDIVPRSKREVAEVEALLCEIVWFFDCFKPEEDEILSGRKLPDDRWIAWLRRADSIRLGLRLDENPISPEQYASVKTKLSAIRWTRGLGWDFFESC